MPSLTNMPLSAQAKAVTLWLLGAAGLPTSLNTYGAFFAGVAAGTLVSPGLFRFIQHHSYNPSRIQLAVFHVIRLFEQRHNYNTIHQDPHKLMAEMEKEVLFMVDRHISATEAGHVMTQLKRSYGVVDIQEKPSKRVRQVNFQERSQLGYLRGFMAEEKSLQVPKETLAALAVSKITSVLMPAENPDAKEAECGCKNMPGGYQNPRSPPRSSNAPSPEPVVLPRPVPNRVPRHQPEKGSFGLDYESKDLYPSDDPDSSPSSSAASSDSDSDVDALTGPIPCPLNRPATYRRSGHPNVVHKVQGLWRVGNSLSPIAGSPATTEGVKATDVRPPPTTNVVKPSSRRLPPSSPLLPPVARLLKKGRGRHRAQDVFVEPPKAAKKEEGKKKPSKAPHNPKWMRRPGYTITR